MKFENDYENKNKNKWNNWIFSQKKARRKNWCGFLDMFVVPSWTPWVLRIEGGGENWNGIGPSKWLYCYGLHISLISKRIKCMCSNEWMAFRRPQHFHRHFYLASLYRFGSWSWYCCVSGFAMFICCRSLLVVSFLCDVCVVVVGCFMRPNEWNQRNEIAASNEWQMYVWWNDDLVHKIFFWQDVICLR